MPLLKPVVEVDGKVQELAAGTMVWERVAQWLPTFTCTFGEVIVRGTVFAPYGRDADLAGAVYAIAVENRGTAEHRVVVRLEGALGHRQLRVRTPRAAEDVARVTLGAAGIVVLEGTAQPGLAALAIGADHEATVAVHRLRFTLERTVVLGAGTTVRASFYLAAGPERDGAEATVHVLRRRGAQALLAGTRDALQALEQSSGSEAIDRLINRNLLFTYFFAVARAP